MLKQETEISEDVLEILLKEERLDVEVEKLSQMYNDLAFFARLQSILGAGHSNYFDRDKDLIMANLWKNISYEFFPANSFIFREHEKSNGKMYIIIAGRCAVGIGRKNISFMGEEQKTESNHSKDKAENVTKKGSKERQSRVTFARVQAKELEREEIVEEELISDDIGHIATYLERGEDFGEEAIREEGGRRSANVRAECDCHMLVIHREAFLRLNEFLEQQKREKWSLITALMPNFIVSSRRVREHVVYSAELRTFERGDIVFTAGKNYDFIYLLKQGRLELLAEIELERGGEQKQAATKKKIEMAKFEVLLSVFEQLEIFGENWVLDPPCPAPYTLRATEPKTEFYAIESAVFLRFYPKECIEAVRANYEEKLEHWRESQRQITDRMEQNFALEEEKLRYDEVAERLKEKYKKTFEHEIFHETLLKCVEPPKIDHPSLSRKIEAGNTISSLELIVAAEKRLRENMEDSYQMRMEERNSQLYQKTDSQHEQQQELSISNLSDENREINSIVDLKTEEKEDLATFRSKESEKDDFVVEDSIKSLETSRSHKNITNLPNVKVRTLSNAAAGEASEEGKPSDTVVPNQKRLIVEGTWDLGVEDMDKKEKWIKHLLIKRGMVQAPKVDWLRGKASGNSIDSSSRQIFKNIKRENELDFGEMGIDIINLKSALEQKLETEQPEVVLYEKSLPASPRMQKIVLAPLGGDDYEAQNFRNGIEALISPRFSRNKTLRQSYLNKLALRLEGNHEAVNTELPPAPPQISSRSYGKAETQTLP